MTNPSDFLQRVEREVVERSAASRPTCEAFADLPPETRTAYAKVVNLAPGSESVWKGKIQTLALPRPRSHARD